MDSFISEEDAAFAELDRRIEEALEANAGALEGMTSGDSETSTILTVSTEGIGGLPASSQRILTRIQSKLPYASGVTVLPQSNRILIG